mgnify:FL=1
MAHNQDVLEHRPAQQGLRQMNTSTINSYTIVLEHRPAQQGLRRFLLLRLRRST